MREEVVVAAMAGATSVDELLWNLGIREDEDVEEITTEIRDVCPGYQYQIRLNVAKSEAAEALARNDKEGIKFWRREMMIAIEGKRKAEEEDDSDSLLDDLLSGGDDTLVDVTQTVGQVDPTEIGPLAGLETEPEPDLEDEEHSVDDPVNETAEAAGAAGSVGVESSPQVSHGEVSESESDSESDSGGPAKSKEPSQSGRSGNKRKVKSMSRTGRRPKGSRNVDPDGLQPVDPEVIDSEPVRESVLGYTGEMYHGRPVVLFRKCPEAFGCEALKRSSNVRLTLHNGILNHMEIGDLSREPTPYWAVLDAASDLKTGFTTEQVLSRALVTVGEDSQLEACRIVWYVLKSHQTHPKQAYRGMSFIIDETVIDGKKVMSIRGRTGDGSDSHQHYDAGRLARKAARLSAKQKQAEENEQAHEVQDTDGPDGEEVPMVTHIVGKAR